MRKDKIDIVTTATVRPAILDRTYQNFCENLLYDRKRYRLLLNVDNIGDMRYSPKDMLKVAQKHFDDIEFNVSDKPSQAAAMKWAWSNTIHDYVFHLQDDWIIREKLDIDNLINILKSYEKTIFIRLFKGRMYGVPKPYVNIKQEHKGQFMQIYRPCLNPGLYRKEFIRGVAPLIQENCNAESQLFPKLCPTKEILDFINKWEYLIWTGNWDGGNWKGRKKMVSDIGRSWRKEHNIGRARKFVNWDISKQKKF